MRAYIRRWWIDDPSVVPCPRCGCPLQTPRRTPMADTLAAHYETVHPGIPVAVVPAGGAS